ncbi:hypothetical protein ACJMK2_012965 [Sinanodonta woodiana]|uniref:G-protein coupled receptors family 1 profile domain-containing protein n=1 Tax=Sinanodonta woodiana TaxID=1069815 RepID=A0ABD3V9X9_SINWO
MNLDQEENMSLSTLNDEVAKENIGGVVFVGILMLVGFIGNSHSVYIYFFRYKSSSYRTFEQQRRYPLMFQNGPVCKIMKMTTYFITIGSAAILLIIATERYRKVCVPHGTQILEDKAKIACVIGCFGSFALSWPTLVLYGSKSVDTGRANITGFDCDVSDEYWETPYPTILKMGLLFVFLISAIALSVIYFLIWRQIVRRKKYRDSITPSSLKTTARSLNDNEGQFEPERNKSEENSSQKNTDTTGSDHESDEQRASNTVKNAHQKKGFKKADKTTLVLFLITIIFCVSFLPHLILRICEFLNKSFVSDMTFLGKVMYNIFRWSFFINHMANPIMYGLYDQKYKSELQRIYKNISYCFCTKH